MSDDQDEYTSDLMQQISSLKGRISKMASYRSDGSLNSHSLEVAQKIEDLFAQHHAGGRIQRLAKIQILVREAIREALTGERDWKSSSDFKNQQTPSLGGPHDS